jgi:hypothetical protein
MSHLIIEILLRLTKVALLIYGVATWVDPSAAGATLGVAALAAAAGIVLLLESSPL